MKTSLGLGLAGALTLIAGMPSAASAQPAFDHLKCYKVKSQRRVKGLVDLVPLQTQFLIEKDCRLKGPKFLCVPVSKENVRVDPEPPGAPPGPDETDHICYVLKCQRPFPPPITVTDQFGTFDLEPSGTRFLCTPARKGSPTTTTTAPPPTTTLVTTSTTTTMPGQPCMDVGGTGAPMCAGDCPVATPECVFVVADGACECVPPDLTCMSQTTGQCGGLCPNASEDCLVDTAGNCDCMPRCETTFPTCGGACPTGTACRSVLQTEECVCSPLLDCDATSPPTCGGVCPVGMQCRQPSPTAGCTCL